ncbi:MAG TPA: DUF4389 domain-containing protein [Gemmatimonadaceae bacterium]|jgi:hypothetical protein|nr:DUF4389 domain-containing protein [Gemmatimonadaceae bacterium]
MPYNPADLVDVDVTPVLTGRNRLTCAFRPILAIPHILLVGGPIAFAGSWIVGSGDRTRAEWGAGTGVLGAVASVVAVIAWFAILFTGRFPDGLWSLAAFYLRWRVRAIAYLTLLRDEYPPFGDEPYPAELILPRPTEPRNKLTVAFRIFLAIPQFIAVAFLGMAWGITTIIAWFSILFTGNYPRGLYDFGVGVLRWTTRVEAYVLLLRDEYPPFSLG